MRRALDLARLGRGRVEPNPMVGCVIEKAGRIIGEGYHRRFGGPHAEIEALASCTESPAGATACVTLEPCCHTNKKTPPCVPAIVAAKLARVVVACRDPNPAVAGQGIEQLRQAGIAVESGLLEPQARQLNAPYFARVLHNRPYVTLKWAQSADGKLAGPGNCRIQISNEHSMRLVHELRSRCDAILVGIGTVLADDPLLTVRDVQPSRELLRVVLDSALRLALDSQLVRTAREHPLLVYYADPDTASARALQQAGVEVVGLSKGEDGRLDIQTALHDLAARDVTHLLVEGGATILASFLSQNLADRVWVFTSPMRIGDGVVAPFCRWGRHSCLPSSMADKNVCPTDRDQLVEMLNPASPVFFHLDPSADFPDPVP